MSTYTDGEIEEARASFIDGRQSGRAYSNGELDYFASILRPGFLDGNGRLDLEGRFDGDEILYSDLLVDLQRAGRVLSEDESVFAELCQRQLYLDKIESEARDSIERESDEDAALDRRIQEAALNR